MEATGTIRNELHEVKVSLKRWEMNFIKQSGHKATKADISLNKEVENMYLKYSRLKKDLLSMKSSKNHVDKSAPTKSQVWGVNLLKARIPDINEQNDSISNAAEVPVGDTEICYREKMKKNVAAMASKALHVRLKNGNYENPVSVNQVSASRKCDAVDDCPSGSAKSTAFHNKVKVINKHALKYNHLIRHKDCGRKFAERSFIDTPIKSSWLNDPPQNGSSTVFASSCNEKHSNNNDFDAERYNFITPNSCKNTTQDLDMKNIRPFHLKTQPKTDEKSLGHHLHDVHNYQPNDFSCVSNDDLQTSKNLGEYSKNEEWKPSVKLCDDSISNSKSLTTTTIEDKTSSETPSKDDFSEKEPKHTINTSKLCSGYTSQNVVSTNYVRINIQKKAYLRKAGRGKFLRRKVFKEKMAKKGFLPSKGWRASQTGRNKSDSQCFKCGELGHWANACKRRSKNTKKVRSFTTTETDCECEGIESIQELISHHQLNSASNLNGLAKQEFPSIHGSEPVYTDESYDREEVLASLRKFGFSHFRPGQEKAIKRILCGEPTLLVLSTGMGKSLCYQLPAYIYSAKRSSITLVISPLVSLMDDQICGLPKFLKAVCLHSGMTKEQRDKIMTQIQEKKVDIVLVSPEAITSWAGMSPYSSPFAKLPPISFVCIDECHCLSEWSHNFRPSYLRVCQVLKEHLGIKCLVGLTATSTVSTCSSIARQLGIDDGQAGLILETSLPENLMLTVSRDKYKDEALQELLTSDPFQSLQSIIVYCTRRDEAARLASYLRTTLQYQDPTFNTPQEEPDVVPTVNSTTKKRKRGTQGKDIDNTNHSEAKYKEASNKRNTLRRPDDKSTGQKRKALAWDVDCYHAGMTAAERRRVQKKFMSGQLRIVVATVAFGMGIDKQDVRAVIHYNMPRSFERYVQEIGRAGRDGETAYCHTFLSCENSDLSELSRHIYAKTVDRYIAKSLLKKIFKRCECKELQRPCCGHYAAIPIDKSIEELDLSKEGIETLLSYLELDSLVKVFLPTHAVCSVKCYEGPQQMAKVAKKCSAVAIGLASKASESSIESDLQFSVVEAANRLNMDVVTLKRILRNLMWDTTLTNNPTSGKSGVHVEFTELSFLLQTLRESNDEFLDEVSEALHNRVLRQEKKELAQLKTCCDTLRKFSISNVSCMKEKALQENSDGLKAVINEYFTDEEKDDFGHEQTCQIEPAAENELRTSVRQFLSIHGADLDYKITGRAIARIFHGIESPRYPATSWGRVRRFWRSHLSLDFNSIVRVATNEILQFR